MTVQELIEELKKYPLQIRVMVSGYEGGYGDVTRVEQDIVALDVNRSWYYSPHERKRDNPFGKGEKEEVEAIIIG